ncbi:hypothetical protein [Corynebacterium suicordis]|uniref:Uncharacterized protein n=1 Tax=Corynebacterium suicordis DSM 45110 TaxID=1121369 RepID=A0ABR9ZGS9_9CORY|nr:hypothetical protein [Corynebacterium suicordis]MBF4552617.1 hypothetical protein [Corynebacterium suicordis DSM 45110]MDR6278424.1 hypothetical protein [Corynebacterium suicordis]
MIGSHVRTQDAVSSARPEPGGKSHNVVDLKGRFANPGGNEENTGEQRAALGLLTLSIEHSITRVGHYTRLLSVSTAMSVAELVEAIMISFAWPEEVLHWSLRVKNHGLLHTYAPGALGATERMLGVRSAGHSVGESLSKGCVAQLQVGEYSFLIHATDMVKHEDAELNAVLLGAEFLPAVDSQGNTVTDAEALHPEGIPAAVLLSQVNIELAGEDTVEQVMSHVDRELKALVHDGELYEFVPLLQALDLERPANVSERSAELLTDAPVEEDSVGRAAAWARIVALSTLVGADNVDEMSESFMQAVGYRRGDVPQLQTLMPSDLDPEDPLTAEEIRELSRETGRLLALAGAGGWGARPGEPVPLVPRCSMVERLEMYRFLLQR